MEQDNRDIVLNNIKRLGKEQTELFERRYAHLAELAELLCDDAGEEEIFFRDSAFVSAYRELASELDVALPESAIEISRQKVSLEGGLLASSSRAFICKRLTDSLGITGLRSVGTYFEDIAGGESEKISYVKGLYSDEAYLRFSEMLSVPEAVYGTDFTEVCENVCYDKTEFCILPVESSSDGSLAWLRRLIIKYGLKISMITRVEEPLGGGVTVFALLKKSITVPDTDGRKYIEIRISKLHSLGTLLSASEALGIIAVSVSSVSGSQDTHDIVFSVSEEGICGFLTYLFLEYKDFVTTGFFGEV